MLCPRILQEAPLAAPWALMIKAGLAGLAGLIAASAQAAGGHHAVDDASIMDPGQCQLELWQERNVHDSGTLTHAGPGCRLGALEWGLNLDRVRAPGEAALTLVGPQAKWAMPLSPSWRVGASVGANWTGREGRYTSSQLLVPVTWQATPALALHGNLGLDQ